MTAPEHLLFYAETNIQISRPRIALAYLQRYFALAKPSTKSDYMTVSFIVKSIIDPHRYSLRTLEKAFHDEMRGERNSDKLKMINFFIDSVRAQLKDDCTQIIGALSEGLIPQTESDREKVFCFKMRADCYRYLAEFEEGAERATMVENARMDYVKASSIAEFLLHSEPLRLSLILKYAVLIYEHMGKRDDAAEMLRKARREAEIDMGQLDNDAHGEALELLKVMRTNLIIWFDDENEQVCNC